MMALRLEPPLCPTKIRSTSPDRLLPRSIAASISRARAALLWCTWPSTGLTFTVAILVAACGGGLRVTGADARGDGFANPEEGRTVGDVEPDAVTSNSESDGSIDGSDAAGAVWAAECSPVDGDKIGPQVETGDEAQDTLTGTDACINIIPGDACVAGDVPCPLECMLCVRWECTDGRWVLSRLCLLMCP